MSDLLKSLRATVSKAKEHSDRFDTNRGFSSYRKFLFSFGAELIAAVELAEALNGYAAEHFVHDWDADDDPHAPEADMLKALNTYREAKGGTE